MISTLYIACAGSGKTTKLVEIAIKNPDKKILLTTFTNENTNEIKRKFYEKIGYIPDNITIIPWFSFELRHLIRPYQSVFIESKIKNICMVNNQSGFKYYNRNKKPVYYNENEIQNYLTSNGLIYSDKISKLSLKIINLSDGKTMERLHRIYDLILVDEMQDLAGYDLELLRLLMVEKFELILATDPRQRTFSTHFSRKFKKYNEDKLLFIKNECSNFCKIDYATLNASHRCPIKIIDYASTIFSQFSKSISSISNRDGCLYLLSQEKLDNYMRVHPNAVQLRYNIKEKRILDEYEKKNIGISKGLSFDDVVIYPTKKMKDFILRNKDTMKSITRSQLYVAITRARYSVAIVVTEKECNEYSKNVFQVWN